ncbi:YfgM family protein [Moellerella wisconsensis]|uniref:YfgM family protein n=1 Tax=Moellerella wisconsensis TaxID=158849 RepID=UPI000640E517|nr:YfgM family protein [Moellerella wisconsensis]KLN96808.1 membrane protein [Moellerella wisconsensis]
MEVYTNENEQVDAIKNFFIDNGKAIVIGLVLGIGAVVGWNYWQSHQTNQLQESAQTFEKVSAQLHTGSAESVAAAEKFAADTKDVYSALIDLQLAQLAVENNKLADAEKSLTAAIEKAKKDELKDLIHLRLARVQLAQNKADAAILSLDKITGKGWGTAAENVRGDALLHKGDKAGAKAAYSKGLEADGSQALKSLMTLKLNNVSN